MARLIGMKEICAYERRSESTMLYLIRFCGYPAKKINEKTWDSDTELADAWHKERLLSTGIDPIPEPVAKKPKRQLDRHKKK